MESRGAVLNKMGHWLRFLGDQFRLDIYTVEFIRTNDRACTFGQKNVFYWVLCNVFPSLLSDVWSHYYKVINVISEISQLENAAFCILDL